MPNFTRKAIIETFIELLDERPLNEITVKNIVEKCGINRNSFYYHFRDLPALIEEIVKDEAHNIIEKHTSISSISECFDAIIDFASNKKRAIMHIYRSVNRDVFERHLIDVCEYFVKQYVRSLTLEEEIPAEAQRAIVNYYKCVCFGLTLNWLAEGMPEGEVDKVRKVFDIQKNNAREIARLL